MNSIFMFRSKKNPLEFLVDCIRISYKKYPKGSLHHRTKMFTTLAMPSCAANSYEYDCRVAVSWSRESAEAWLKYIRDTYEDGVVIENKFDDDAYEAIISGDIEVVEFTC